MNEPTGLCWIRVLARSTLNSVSVLPDEAYRKVPDVRSHGQIPPVVFSGPRPDGKGSFWHMEGRFAGDPNADTVFDLGPAFVERAAAEAWIETEEGRQWAAEASNHFMLSIWPESAFALMARKAPSAQGSGKFPDSEWLEAYAHLHQAAVSIDLFKPQDFTVPPYPADPSEECAELARLAGDEFRTPARLAEIATQAQSVMHAIQPVFDIVGIDLNGPPAAQAKMAIDIVVQNITRTVFDFKMRFNRARPWNAGACAKAVKPLWPRNDRLFPGHASYPSGHATLAFAWAHFLAAHFPADKEALLVAAARVAKNREIAGVHFASDSQAGRDLGESIAKTLIAVQRGPAIPDFDLQALVQLGRSSSG